MPLYRCEGGAIGASRRCRCQTGPAAVRRHGAEPSHDGDVVKSAKGAARTAKDIRNRLAPHSVLRVFLKKSQTSALDPTPLDRGVSDLFANGLFVA